MSSWRWGKSLDGRSNGQRSHGWPWIASLLHASLQMGNGRQVFCSHRLMTDNAHEFCVGGLGQVLQANMSPTSRHGLWPQDCRSKRLMPWMASLGHLLKDEERRPSILRAACRLIKPMNVEWEAWLKGFKQGCRQPAGMGSRPKISLKTANAVDAFFRAPLEGRRAAPKYFARAACRLIKPMNFVWKVWLKRFKQRLGQRAGMEPRHRAPISRDKCLKSGMDGLM